MPKAIAPQSALILIVLAQFLGTSLWFAGNATAPELESVVGQTGLVSVITSSVQLGFIVGTLIFAFLSIPDRYSPSQVFFVSAIFASICNLSITLLPLSLQMILVFRFLTGFFLAGIYPVGMKIAADYFEKGLGSALGYLVGALVLGTASPFLLKALGISISWKLIFWSTSGFALLGGMLVGFGVPDGPFRKANPKFDPTIIPALLKNKSLKGAASGYFGHMWELYTFWAFLPVLIQSLKNEALIDSRNALWTFLIIAAGALSCAFGGWLSLKKGSENVARMSLMGSGICCLFVLIIPDLPHWALFAFLAIWGMLVVADSPQFSSLVAQSISPEQRGTALTLVNSIGFGITIVSIQVAQVLSTLVEPKFVLGLLVFGPLTGLLTFRYFRS